jgi:hypothetical protein
MIAVTMSVRTSRPLVEVRRRPRLKAAAVNHIAA